MATANGLKRRNGKPMMDKPAVEETAAEETESEWTPLNGLEDMPAVEETAAESTPPVKPIEESKSETELDAIKAGQLLRDSESNRTIVMLQIGALLANRIMMNVMMGCHSRDDIGKMRENVMAVFAIRIGEATGLAMEAKKMTEWLKAHALYTLLTAVNPALGAKLHRISWETIRILNRWMDYRAKESEFRPTHYSETRDVMSLGHYHESWTFKENCEERLIELVESYSIMPVDRDTVRENLNDHEEALAKAALMRLASADRKAVVEAQKTRASAVKMKKTDSFFANILETASKLGLSKSEVSDQLIRRGMVEIADPIDPTTMSTEDAALFVAALIECGNDDAIGGLYNAILPYITEANRKKA